MYSLVSQILIENDFNVVWKLKHILGDFFAAITFLRGDIILK